LVINDFFKKRKKIKMSEEKEMTESTIDTLLEDIKKYIAPALFNKVHSIVTFHIESLVDKIDIEIKSSERTPYSENKSFVERFNSPLESKRILAGEIDDNSSEVENDLTEKKLDIDLNQYFKEGDMNMYVQSEVSSSKKRSRDSDDDEEVDIMNNFF
jgi:hypothetical protein